MGVVYYVKYRRPTCRYTVWVLMEYKILLVDDEQNILDGFKRQLRNTFKVETAISGAEGLERLAKADPFAVVVSDMLMPVMNGIEFLKQVRKCAPDTVRLMLTGLADQSIAVNAVNESNIFRFLTKPCPTENLAKALDDALTQYKLVMAEKDLLQNTLVGSIKVITEILSMIDPVSFGEAVKTRERLKKVARELGIDNAWDFELAAMLANIGCAAIPAVVLEKLHSEQILTAQEEEMVSNIPEIGKSLLSNIPRLEKVAEMVSHQNKKVAGTSYQSSDPGRTKIELGARALKILRDLSQLELAGIETSEAINQMQGRDGWYDPQIFQVVGKLFGSELGALTKPGRERFEIRLHELCAGQTILADVRTKDGLLLLHAGNVLTVAMIQRLKNHAKLVGIREPICVDSRAPSHDYSLN